MASGSDRREEGTSKHLERELKKWREMRARKPAHQASTERRTVRVNGQEVLVITKPRKVQE